MINLTKQTKITTKIIIAVLSLILSLGILEIGLRVSGFFILQQAQSQSSTANYIKAIKHNKKEIKILTLGDSVTFGGWGTTETSYPAQLQVLLDKLQPNHYFVENNGMCGNTTTDVRNNLEQYINIHKPDYIILLIGAANRYRFDSYNFEKSKIQKNFWRNLRVVKMINFIYRELEQKYVVHYNNKPYANVETMWIDYGSKSPQFLKQTRNKLLSNHHYLTDISSLIRLSHIEEQLNNLPAAEKYIQLALKQDPKSNDIRTNYAFLKTAIANQFIEQHKYAEAIKVILSAIEQGPNNQYLANIFKSLTTVFKNQSTVTAQEIAIQLEKIMQQHPQFKENKIFLHNYQYFQDTKQFDQTIKNWILTDLNHIIEVCKQYNVKLLLMNYPMPYHMANELLQSMAQKNKLPFINLTKKFKQLIGNDKRKFSYYIKDDDHCTEEGHKIIAQEIRNYFYNLRM